MKCFFPAIVLITVTGCTKTRNEEPKVPGLTIPIPIEKYFSEQPASDELIERTEKAMGLNFPPQLREFYKLHNGYENVMFQYPYWETESEYLYKGKPSVDGLLVIAHCYDTDTLYDFLPTFSIQYRKRSYKEIPEWLLPFGVATDQSQLCISLRDSDYGKIYFFSMSLYFEMTEEDLEEEPLSPLFFVSPSLQEFFNSLREPD